MKTAPRFQWTIGQGMVGILTVAVVLTLAQLPAGVVLTVVAGAIAIPAILLLTRVLVDVLFGIPCPRCAHWTLRRLARRRAYSCCKHCGARFMHFGLGPWEDASGPEHGAIFRGKARAHVWRGFATPEDHDDTTTGALLHVHRRRGRERRKPANVDPLLVRLGSHIGSWRVFSGRQKPDDTTTGLLLQNQRKRRESNGGPPAGTH